MDSRDQTENGYGKITYSGLTWDQSLENRAPYRKFLSENVMAGAHTYSQLSRKRPPLGHDKVVAYRRWSLTGKINNISLMLD